MKISTYKIIDGDYYFLITALSKKEALEKYRVQMGLEKDTEELKNIKIHLINNSQAC